MSAALNSCGYDTGLATSLPLRQTVRGQVQSVLGKSDDATTAHEAICQFWREHQTGNGDDVTPYVSLAFNLGPPPNFATMLPEADLPPDAARVLGVVSPLQKFWQAAGVHALWLKEQPVYDGLVKQFHDPVSKVVTETDLYLRLPFSNFPGQRFIVQLEPQLSPAEIQSRNYGSNYLVLLSPNKDGQVRLQEVRHTYLHFVLDPFALKHGTGLKRLEPLLEDVRTAPMADSFKNDVSLMVNECLIRAIEARISIPSSDERAREAYVERSMEEGFILTRHFYEALRNFERGAVGLKDAYGDILHDVSLEREHKRAKETVFGTHATPEIVSSVRSVSSDESILDAAEQKMAVRDYEGARQLAQKVLQQNHGGESPGRAAFILARVATQSGKMQEARDDFEKAIKSGSDARTMAWSHIYLGRIMDIQQDRDAAVEHYRAALAAGDASRDTQAAAENGLAAPYLPKRPR